MPVLSEPEALPLGRSLSRRLSKPFILREPPSGPEALQGRRQDERLSPNVLSEVEGRAHHERIVKQ